MVLYTGTVFWPPPTQLRSTCKGDSFSNGDAATRWAIHSRSDLLVSVDVSLFPFDEQRCSLKFGSWTYHGFQVDVTNRSENIDLTNYVPSGEFDLVKVRQHLPIELFQRPLSF